MKKIIYVKILLLSVIVVILYCANAQAQQLATNYTDEEIDEMVSAYRSGYSVDVKPNAALVSKFKSDFIDARDVEWETDAGIYVAEFEIGKVDYTAYYDDKANLLMYMFDIRNAKLPGVVKDAIKTKYPVYCIEDVAKIRKGSQTLYLVEVEHNDDEIGLLCKCNGSIEIAYGYEQMGRNLKRQVPVKK